MNDEPGMMGEAKRQGAVVSGTRLSVLVLHILVFLCCALPLLWILVQLLSNPQLWRELNPGAYRWGLLGRTLFYNFLAALLACILALPAAWVIGRGRGRLASLLTFLTPIAALLPSVTYTYAWYGIIADTRGAPVPSSWGDVLRCIWTLATWLWGIPALTLGLSLRRLDPQLQLQALLDGGLWRVTCRHLLTPLAAALALVTILGIQEFAVYERTGISVVSTEVRTVFQSGAFSSATEQTQRAGAALAVALPLMLCVVCLGAAPALLLARMPADDIAETGHWPRALDAPRLAKILCALVLLITVLAPLLYLLLSISHHRWRVDRFGHTFPVRIWLWAGPRVLGTLLTGSAAGAIALLIALLALVRRSRPLLAIAVLSFLMGGEMLAVANIHLFNRPGLMVIYENLPLMLLAMLGRYGWIALLAAQAAPLPGIRALRETAALDGATPVQSALHIAAPLLAPILLAAAILVAILSMTEVPATMLIDPQNPQVLIRALMEWVHNLNSDDMLEGSLLLILLAGGLGAVVLLLARYGATLARRVGAAAPLLLVVLLIGCDKPTGDQPEAIWMSTGGEVGQLAYPRGIAYSQRDNCFFVVDRTARIQRVESDGKVSHWWRMPDHVEGKPVGLTVGPDGNLYVADTHYFRIMVFSPRGEFIRKYGQNGHGPGQFMWPMDVAFDRAGNIYVCETGGNDRIQVFTSDFKFLRQISSFGQDDGLLARPVSLLIDDDLLYVTDASNHRISVFTLEGKWLRHIGQPGSEPGQFRFPYGLARDLQGHLVVAEYGNNRIQIIDKQTGACVRRWGRAGREKGQVAYPWAVDVDQTGRIVVVDSGNNRLQVFK